MIPQTDHIPLRDERQLRVRTPGVALPVWVVGDVACWEGDGVFEREGVVGSGGWVAEMFEGNTIGAFRGDGEGAADTFPDSS